MTARDVARQWWEMQLTGAAVQGRGLIAEGLSQYTAAMVVRQESGEGALRPYLRRRLDAYLSGRSQENEGELPLGLEEDQPYISRDKGVLALFALQNHIGEDAVNRGLAAFYRQFALREPPFATTAAS